MRIPRVAAVPAALAALGGCLGSGSVGAEVHADLEDWPDTAVAVHAGEEVHELTAVVAANPERRQRGLQHVEELPDDVGMLFVFPRDTDGGFWMKDTLIPLEIAFADGDGAIVGVFSMEPCQREPCRRTAPAEPYRAALEVADGWLSDREVGRGDRLEWGEVPDPG